MSSDCGVLLEENQFHLVIKKVGYLNILGLKQNKRDLNKNWNFNKILREKHLKNIIIFKDKKHI